MHLESCSYGSPTQHDPTIPLAFTPRKNNQQNSPEGCVYMHCSELYGTETSPHTHISNNNKYPIVSMKMAHLSNVQISKLEFVFKQINSVSLLKPGDQWPYSTQYLQTNHQPGSTITILPAFHMRQGTNTWQRRVIAYGVQQGLRGFHGFRQ